MKRGFLNAVTAFTNQILILIIGLFVPRLFLTNFGSEVNGLIGSINQVFVYFALLEAGIGAASLQALYHPVARKDHQEISAILSSTKHFFQRTGFYYFLSVIAFALIFPYVVQSKIPQTTIVALILIQGMVGVLNYWIFGKYKVLFEAEGKQYVISNLDAVVRIFTNVLRIVFMLLGFNVIVVQTAYVILSVVQCSFVYGYIRRKYKWLDLNAKPNHAATSHKKNALVHQISALVFNNTDILVVSAFCGFKMASVYMMYSMFFDLVSIMAIRGANSVSFALGQAYHTNQKRFLKLYQCFETYYYVFSFTLFTVLYIFILPFIKLYTAGIYDVNYIDPYLPILFLSVHLLSTIRIPTNCTINYAGHFKQTQTSSMIEAGMNVVLSLVLVQFIGIYGALLGSIAALFYRSNDIILYANKALLKRNPWHSYKKCLVNLAILAGVIFGASQISLNLDSYFSLAIWGVIYAGVIGTVFFVASMLLEKEAFLFLLQSVKSMKKGRC